MKILLVDDDHDEQILFAHAMEKIDTPITLLYANNGKELFNRLEEDPDINLIFLDIHMPELDGKQCLKQLKSNERFYHIPVLVYSVSQSIQDIDEAFQSGAHYFAIKPYAAINFIETLKLVLNIDWTIEQPIPPRDQFVINLAFA